ncbi:hypothetical protein R3P38DRAFT_3182953 [Favolaschia claudopus]|uniref:Uncharacterized protein n=1 Tax=Favolaschia claudopus TaxID=2862362 RepID=A0AAW0CDP3_9AGAR
MLIHKVLHGRRSNQHQRPKRELEQNVPDNNEDTHLADGAFSFLGPSSEPASLLNEASAVDQRNMQVENDYYSSLYTPSQNTQYMDHTATGNTFAHWKIFDAHLHFGGFNYGQFDDIMATINGYVPPDSQQEGTMNTVANASNQEIEYGADNLYAGESRTWRASQELPPIPQPRSDTLEPSAEFPGIPEESETADFEEPVAAQNIDLELDERNILTGKRARTKSARAKDLERASKRRI